MKRFLFLEDTITRRLVVTVALAAGVTLLLLQLFFAFGGTWAKPDVQATGLVQQVATVIRLVDAATPAERAHLADAASTDSIHYGWYEAGSTVAGTLEHGQYLDAQVQQSRAFLQPFLTRKPDRIVVFQEDNPVSRAPGLPYDRVRNPDAYFVGVRLADGSWILGIALQRFWGFDPLQRLLLQIPMLALWVIAVSLIASRQLSRPIEHLADSVRRLTHQPPSGTIEEAGPREIRLVAQTINGMQAQIQRFIEYRTTMLAAISHDLRTPLTRIRLRGEYIDDKWQQANLFRDVDEMQAMIDGALSFFRDDAASEAATMFDLPGLLQTIAYDYSDQGHRVDYHGPNKSCYVGRLYALKRVFTNLVENSIKYGTPPTIDLERQGDGSMIVFVRDRGPGIPPDALPRVFDPYFRVDKSRNRQTGGVGLGLTSAQAIIRSHGGDIVMENRAGGGLEVRVLLPPPTQSGRNISEPAHMGHTPEKPAR
ncbi:sensor histidine kinase [Gluconacetobacter takamatsuzukensis]|uniref:histidine kinase n=1 Tax=Gluconacetobacter takamatsuzukensis TaxID=1286190 RepID=A0A7W4PPT6_9PROT|nr:ATP-binding protein [Gluconacetobacter takamatsuzukensis]MBB2205583.1 HAMP domain-containing protein [Gluconacetobacter takamatsuzukensis]